MSIEPHHLDHALRTLGKSVLNLDFSAHQGSVDELVGGFTWAGLVQLSGDFTGGFALRCGTQAAEALAQGLLEESGQISDDLLQSTLMELVQLIAGSLVPLMEGQVRLAPARSMQGASVARVGAASKIEARSVVQVAGEALEVALFRS